jgi:hypothetical protein
MSVAINIEEFFIAEEAIGQECYVCGIQMFVKVNTLVHIISTPFDTKFQESKYTLCDKCKNKRTASE